ncbi:GMC oxidoreductase [Sphaerobolus stellatus SS14]|nr:GMC oxidoreductase [Sphaerobolus stellatus SS14]
MKFLGGITAWLLLSALNPCLGALYEDASNLPSMEFDFVIVGGGTAGNVIANRLTEDPRNLVLVLEAGVSNEGVLDSIVPYLNGNLIGATPFNWNFTTIPQKGLNGRTYSYPRGHMLGGSSSINGLFYTRGSADDYDRYARVTGDAGWSWDNLQSYIRKNEQWTAPTDGHNATGEFNPAVHGFHGINSVSLAGFPSPIDSMVIQTTQQLPEEFPFNLDTNSGKPLGLGWFQSTIKKGVRSSSATSYLAPEFLSRPNLHVLLNARVTRLLKTSQGNQRLAFQQVEFSQSGPKGPRLRVQASKEVILSAGSIGTPFILMHSGIGDRTELQKLDIQPLLHLPSVGKNASDHPVLGVSWEVNSVDTLDTLNRNATVFQAAFKLWNETHGGPLGNPGSTHIGWQRLANNASIFKQFPDPSAGPNTAHIELAVQNGGTLIISTEAPTGNFFAIGVIVVTPASRGSVALSSNNPFDMPLIDTAVLTSDFDLFAVREGIRRAQRFVTAPVWKSYIVGLSGGLQNVTTDAELDDYIRNNTSTAWHLAGTSAMSAPGATYGVVNPDLRVKGVNGLRIVDASIFPFVPSAHTQAPTYIIAERAADIIKSFWS